MNSQRIEALLQELAAHPGIQGCALVESGSGMVWFHSGGMPDIEATAEAAIEFWRVHARHAARFAPLGEMQSAACSFRDHVIALFPCTPGGLVLVCVAAKASIDWTRWGVGVQVLKQVLAAAASTPAAT